MAVYLLHSTVPLIRENGSEVRHYLGWTCEGNMPDRLEAHYENRKSAKIVQEFLRRGGELWLGRYWEGLTRLDEKRMKLNGHISSHCRVCQLIALRDKWIEDMGTAGLSLPLGGGHLTRPDLLEEPLT
jgi:hypothetical protein